jgi:hypothetical protein
MASSRSDIHKPNPKEYVEFGQEKLAESIDNQIDRDHNVHIAVNGPWGSGKTTVLEHAKERIQTEDSNVITAWYEPWRYGPDQTTLRRTFLKTLDEAVANDLDEDVLVKKERFYFDDLDSQRKNIREFLIDFGRAFTQHLLPIGLISIIAAILFTVGLFITTFSDSVLYRFVGNLASSSSFLFLTILIFYMKKEIAGELADQTTFDVKEPKISEIDLFEDYYEEVLDRADDNDKRIVIFIDDVDRCNNDEIREVITGLSTYLDPDHNSTDVAFVAAIDGPKIIQSFEKEENNGRVDPNILNKTFQVILPVPTPSKNDVTELIRKTSDELDYPITEGRIQRMASVSVSHADSNLRIIRSALCESQWLKEYGRNNLLGDSYEKSQSFKEILNNDFNLYRIALIKLLSEDEDLRKLVTDANCWLGDRSNLNIHWDLFDLQQKFESGNLDPRPFFGLNSPNEYVSDVHDMDDIFDRIGSGNIERAMKMCQKYDESAKLDIAYTLMDRDWDSADENTRHATTQAIKNLLLESTSLLNEHRHQLFKDCLDLYNKRLINNHPSDYPDWLEIAYEIGDEALNNLIDQSCPFYNRDKRSFLKDLNSEATNYGIGVIDRVLELELTEIEGGQRNRSRSISRTRRIFKENIVCESRNAPEYLIKTVRNWDFNDDGRPRDEILRECVIEKLDSNEYKKDAADVYSARVPSGDFKEKIKKKGWPVPHND